MQAEPRPSIQALSSRQLYNLLEQTGHLLLDVRPAIAFKELHIKTALSLDASLLSSETVSD
jgi:rhodanese-related sulfurtransferase